MVQLQKFLLVCILSYSSLLSAAGTASSTTTTAPAARKFFTVELKNTESIQSDLQKYIAQLQDETSQARHREIARRIQMQARRMTNMPEAESDMEKQIARIIAIHMVSMANQLRLVGYNDLYQLIGRQEVLTQDATRIFETAMTLEVWDDLDLVYDYVRSRVQMIYAPIIRKERNVDFVIQLSEEYPDNAGGVSLYSDVADISVGIDMHRNPDITPDGYLAMLCHETGHLLGGEPYSNSPAPSPMWQSSTPSSSEGQSDYFSGQCMRKIFSTEVTSSDIQYKVSPKVKKLCQTKYADTHEQNTCMRTARAGFDLMTYVSGIFEKYGGKNDYMKKPNMDVSEKPGVSVGKLYATPQCRYDTILAGALQQKRPDCWYVEEKKK